MQRSISIFTLHCIRNFIRATTSLELKTGCYLICVTGNGLIVKTTNTQLHLLLCQHALDAADKNVFANPYPLPVTFKDVKKFDAQNPVLVNLLTQIEGNKLSDEEIKKS